MSDKPEAPTRKHCPNCGNTTYGECCPEYWNVRDDLQAAESALAEVQQKCDEKIGDYRRVAADQIGHARNKTFAAEEQLRIVNEENAKLREQVKRLQDRDDYVAGCLV